MKVSKRPLALIALSFMVVACSPTEAINVAKIAATGNASSVGRVVAEKAVRYAVSPKALKGDFRRFEEMLKRFRKSIESVWGKKEAKEPSQREYVKYTQGYLSRAAVDFDRGLITVETLDEKQPLKSLKKAIVTALLAPNDPRSVDLYSASEIEMGTEPFLYREVRDFDGEYIRWSWRAERFADQLIARGTEKRAITSDKGTRSVHCVNIEMVRDHTGVRAGKFRHIVEKFSEEYSLSRSLVYAIIKTESNFNPYAVSRAPAFGLMQIVPSTAGSDVYLILNGKKGTPSGSALFDPATNIRYGSAYLHLLSSRYLKGVKNPVSREYCVIAAYNAGAGEVLRTFDVDRYRAPRVINGLAPLGVFERIRTSISKAEARRYIVKVTEARKEFVNF